MQGGLSAGTSFNEGARGYNEGGHWTRLYGLLDRTAWVTGHDCMGRFLRWCPVKGARGYIELSLDGNLQRNLPSSPVQ